MAKKRHYKRRRYHGIQTLRLNGIKEIFKGSVPVGGAALGVGLGLLGVGFITKMLAKASANSPGNTLLATASKFSPIVGGVAAALGAYYVNAKFLKNAGRGKAMAVGAGLGSLALFAFDQLSSRGVFGGISRLHLGQYNMLMNDPQSQMSSFIVNDPQTQLPMYGDAPNRNLAELASLHEAEGEDFSDLAALSRLG